VPGTGQKAPDRLEPQTIAIRTTYVPLFRKYHVDLMVCGHDHLYDHFAEQLRRQRRVAPHGYRSDRRRRRPNLPICR